MIKDIHTRKPSYGYHRINAVIKREVGLVVSDNLVHKVCKILNISSGMLHRWVEVYKKDGIKGLENKKKPGNPLMKYSRKKSLTELEKLEYENMKLRIENELLKKGYLMKGDGSLVTFKNKNK